MKNFPRFVAHFVALALSGVALMLYWSWFVISVFNAPPLPWPAVFGIVLIIKVMTVDYIPRTEKENNSAAVSAVLTPLVGILIGLIVQLFM